MPAPLGSVILLLITLPQEEGISSDFILKLAATVFIAYVFCVIPSTLYAGLMEMWFRKSCFQKCGLLSTVTLSATLGGIGGGCVELLSHPFTQSSMMKYLVPDGAIVGCLIGLILVLGETRPPPNDSRASE